MGALGLRAAALSYLAIMLLIPLAIIFQDGLREGIGGFWSQVTRADRLERAEADPVDLGDHDR